MDRGLTTHVREEQTAAWSMEGRGKLVVIRASCERVGKQKSMTSAAAAQQADKSRGVEQAAPRHAHPTGGTSARRT